MRSFSKKLAFVLAAAMVVTAFAPAAKAEAAKEMAINKSSQILYVNEGINHKGGEVAAPGKGNVSVYDFSVKNKPADWKTAYSFAWSSSDEDVVSVAKGGVATAVGVGKATVYCKVTEKATKEVTTLKTKVTVKANADKVEISNADKWDGATVEVGGVVDLNRTMYDENGNKATSRTKGCVTDYTKWVAEPAAGVEIDQKTGKFTFTEDAVAGEYKLSCYTYQSSKYTEKTAESDVVMVEFQKADTFEVDQTAVNKVNLLLNKAAEIAIADVTINKIIKVGDSTGKLPMVVADVTMSDDKKTASVSLFSHLEDGVTYEVSVKGYEETVAMTAFVGKPVSMTISSLSYINNGAFVVVGTPTQLVATLYDEQGNDVTLAKTTTGYVSFAAANGTTGDYYVTSDSICIYKEGAQVVVDAVYHTGEFDSSANEKVVKASGQFVGVNAAPIIVTDVKLAVKYSWGGDYANNQVPVSDNNAYLDLQIKTSAWQDELNKYESGDRITKLDPSELNIPVVSFRSSNPDVLDIDGENPDAIRVFKPGTAAVLVDLTTVNADGTPNVTTIASVLVTVTARREAASIQVGNGGTLTIGTVEDFNSGRINVVVKDQYGSNMDIDELKNVEVKLPKTTKAADAYVELIAPSPANGYNNQAEVTSAILDLVLAKDDDGEYVWEQGKNEVSVHVTGKAVCNKWWYQYYAEMPFNFVVTVRRPNSQTGLMVEAGGFTSGNVGRYSTSWDGNLDGGNADTEGLKTAEFKVFATSNGIKTAQVEAAPKLVAGVPSDAAEGKLYYVVTRSGEDITVDTKIAEDGTVLVDYSAVDTSKQFASCVEGVMTMVTGSSIVTYGTANYKTLGAGTYTFTVYKVVKAKNSDALSLAFVGSTSTTVTNDIGGYSFVKRTSEAATHTNNNGVSFTYNPTIEWNAAQGIYNFNNQIALRDCFEIKGRDGKVTTTPNFFVEAIDTDKYVNVKSITFYEDLGDNTYAAYTVGINVSLKK